MTEATRDRLISAALKLFAERGMDGVAIGDVEAAAGLTRRGGSFYKYFSSKEEALVAAVERHVRHGEGIAGFSEVMPLGDLRSELTLMCRALLRVLAVEREILKLVDLEGDRLPVIRRLMRERLLEPGAAEAAGFVERWLQRYPRGGVDVEATATLLLGSIVNFQRTVWTFGAPTLGVDEARFITAWVEHWVGWFEHDNSVAGSS